MVLETENSAEIQGVADPVETVQVGSFDALDYLNHINPRLIQSHDTTTERTKPRTAPTVPSGPKKADDVTLSQQAQENLAKINQNIQDMEAQFAQAEKIRQEDPSNADHRIREETPKAWIIPQLIERYAPGLPELTDLIMNRFVKSKKGDLKDEEKKQCLANPLFLASLIIDMDRIASDTHHIEDVFPKSKSDPHLKAIANLAYDIHTTPGGDILKSRKDMLTDRLQPILQTVVHMNEADAQKLQMITDIVLEIRSVQTNRPGEVTKADNERMTFIPNATVNTRELPPFTDPLLEQLSIHFDRPKRDRESLMHGYWRQQFQARGLREELTLHPTLAYKPELQKNPTLTMEEAFRASSGSVTERAAIIEFFCPRTGSLRLKDQALIARSDEQEAMLQALQRNPRAVGYLIAETMELFGTERLSPNTEHDDLALYIATNIGGIVAENGFTLQQATHIVLKNTMKWFKDRGTDLKKFGAFSRRLQQHVTTLRSLAALES